MPRDQQIAYGFLCLASLGFYAFVIPWQIEEPDWVAVSPALLPRVCAVLVFVLALYKLLVGLRLGGAPAIISGSNYAYLFGTTALIAALAYAMYWLGFWVCAGAAVVAMQVIAGQRNPVIIALYSVALVGASWFLLDLAGLYIIAPY